MWQIEVGWWKIWILSFCHFTSLIFWTRLQGAIYTQIVTVNILICYKDICHYYQDYLFWGTQGRIMNCLSLDKNRGWFFSLEWWPFSVWALCEWLNYFYPLKWIQHTWKTYFWHQDYKNQLISYWVMAISILVVCMAAILEICKLGPMGHFVTGNIWII